jgi:transposase-like protein
MTGFCCIKGISLRFRLFGPPYDRRHRAGSDLSRSKIPIRNHRVMRTLVPNVPPELSRPCRNLAERGVTVSHTTIYRWVQQYVPEFERRWSRYAKPVHPSWRVDETAILVRGGQRYLYRAVDKFGKTVDSLLCADRSVSAARAFFCKALKTHHPRRPRKLNLDGNAASHRALRLLRKENPELQSVVIRSCRYLNNIVEQDHRAIKRRCAPMLALKSFRTAAVTLDSRYFLNTAGRWLIRSVAVK